MEDNAQANAPDPSADHLFAQMDDILTNAHLEGLDLDLDTEDLQDDLETVAAELAVVDGLIEHLPDSHIGIRVLKEYALRDPTKPMGFIANELMHLLDSPEAPRGIQELLTMKVIELAFNVSYIANAAKAETDPAMKSLQPTKSKVQLQILESEVHSGDDKKALLEFVDTHIEGEGLTLDDPDSVAAALSSEAQEDIENEARDARMKRVKSLVHEEFSKYDIAPNDPLLAHLLLVLVPYIAAGTDEHTIVQFVTNDSFRPLGIDDEDARQSVMNILDEVDR